MKMISKAYWNIFVFLALGIPTWTQFTLGLSLVSKDIESRNIKNSVYTHQNVKSVSYKNDIENHRNFLSLEPQKLSREWVTENIFTHIEVLHTVNSTSPCYFIDKSLEFMICENSAKIEPDHIPAMLTYLHVRNVELSSLEELSLRNKSINVLLVTNTKITNITRSDLTGLADIKYLHLGGNLIQAKNSIFQSFFANFQDLTNLTHLDLSKNSISLTDVDEYQKNEDLLHNLESISFAGNPIRTLERNIFFTIRNSRLKRLDFSDCELTHIDPYTFQHLDFLEELELKENGGLFKLDPNHSPLSSALYYLPSNTFSYLGLARSELLITPTASLFVAKNSLRKLDFSSNLFFGTFLKYSILPYLRCLEELILSKNYISDIKENAFQHLGRLEVLNMSHNSLLTVPQAVQIPNIKTLDLSFQCAWYAQPYCLSNYIQLNLDSFRGMDNLENLHIKGISVLTPDMLSGAGQIVLLDISSHYLTSIQENSFKNMTKLRSLTCSQCWLLNPVPLAAWMDLKDITYLDFSYSPMSVIPAGRVGPRSGGYEGILENIKIKALSPAMLEDIKSLEYINLMTHPTDLIICDVQVVNFYKWSLERGNLTYIEGWKGGKGYTCDDISNNRVKSFEEFALNYVEPKQPVDHTLEGILAGVCLSRYTGWSMFI
ncbi:insulin-like growth factor-binding protein complex acid labile subunit [Eurytemora carolleeae]|uniref:insulin-like growth factor-binding protein complex acid labile subunit n=1 Tax=Eurytemora carolleeae TaxID=1294199 RepID=UPI000C76FEEF|nr:insulin-like growth factor-binding protein complex acid labile subunit [Eurytemora carolleeae]|eukprot:XP_023342301.1 insulin-like growth factor-binding protein complex acid labile subunit [Eurytemora affinis]